MASASTTPRTLSFSAWTKVFKSEGPLWALLPRVWGGIGPLGFSFPPSSGTGYPRSNSRCWDRGLGFGSSLRLLWRSQKHLLFPGWASTDSVCQWLVWVRGVAPRHWFVTSSHLSYYWFYQLPLTGCGFLRCYLSSCTSMCQCSFLVFAGYLLDDPKQTIAGRLTTPGLACRLALVTTLCDVHR